LGSCGLLDEFYEVECHINIERLKERQSAQIGQKFRDSDRPMLGADRHARMNLDQLLTPLMGPAQFGHFRPIRYSPENVAAQGKALSAAFGRFETAFK